jgi:hypothetical protein
MVFRFITSSLHRFILQPPHLQKAVVILHSLHIVRRSALPRRDDLRT